MPPANPSIGLAPQFGPAQIPAPLVAVIPANGTRQFSLQGQFFYVKECYGIPGNVAAEDFTVATDQTGPIPFNVGTGLRFEGGSQFRTLQIVNPNAFELYIEIVAGYGQYIDRRLNIVRVRVDSIQPVIEPPIEIDPWLGDPVGTYVIPPGTGVLITPVLSGDRFAVKGFTVANGDPNSPVDIRNAAGVPFGRVIANTSQLFPGADPFEVYNDTGAGIEVFIGVLYWTQAP
jgi:hypothetical protein